MKRTISRRRALALGLAPLAWPLPAPAADAPARTEPGARLDAARAEGGLTVYSSMPAEDMAAIARAFESRFGMKVQTWRSGSKQIVQRVIAETRASRQEFDLLETNAGALESMRLAGAFQSLPQGLGSAALPAAAPAHRHWTGTRLTPVLCTYNTRLVASAEVPTRYQDLVDPRWRQRIAFESEDFEWYATLATALGEAESRAFFDAIAGNGILVRKGHSLIANLVAAGELPLTLTAYAYRVEQLISAGAPIAYRRLDPTVASAHGLALGRFARHPQSAALFAGFLLGEGQAVLAARHHLPITRASAEPSKDGQRMVIIDPQLAVGDTGRAWRERYEAFLRRGLARG